MEIKVLGSGCANCTKLEKLVREALAELKREDPVIKVTDIKEIVSYKVMSTPALVINGKVKFAGVVPNKAKLIEVISSEI